MNLYQKIIEVRKLVKSLQKDTVGKVGFKDYPYISTDLILDKIMDKMNELELLLQPNITSGREREFHYQNSKGDSKIDFIVNGNMKFVWINAEQPEEREVIDFYYYGQQDEVSKAYGSGLTYSNRYFLKLYFMIATSEDDPDQKDTTGKQPNKPTTVNKLSDAQVNRAFVIAKGKGYSVETVKKWALEKYKVTEIAMLNKPQYDEFTKGLESMEPKH